MSQAWAVTERSYRLSREAHVLCRSAQLYLETDGGIRVDTWAPVVSPLQVQEEPLELVILLSAFGQTKTRQTRSEFTISFFNFNTLQ